MLNEYDELMKDNSEGGNEYDSVVAGSIEQDKQALAGSMYVAQKKDPAKQAEYERLSQETNLPPDFIERNYDKVIEQYKIKRNPDDVYNKAPKSSTWLSNPNNAALSKDELDQIISMENNAGVVGKKETGFLKNLGNAATTGSYQLKSSAWQLALAFDKADLDEAANEIAASYKKQAELRNQAPQYAKDFQKEMQGDIEDIDKAFNQFVSSYDEISEGNILNALKNFTVGGAGTVYETLDAIGSSVKSKDQIKGLIYSSTEQLANSAPGLIGGASGAAAGSAVFGLPGAAVGGVVGGFAGSAPAEIGASIGEIASKKGFDFSNPEDVKRFYRDPAIKKEIIDAAIRKGVTTAAVDSLFNLFAGAKTAKAIGKGGKIATVAKEAAKDVGVQMAGETASEFAGQVAREKGLEGTSLGEAASEGITSLGTSVVTTPVGAAVRLRSELSEDPIQAAGELVDKADEAITVEEKVVALKNIGEEVKKMEVVASVPGKVAELVNVMVGDSETKSVFFQSSDWKKYWEDKGLNPVEEISKILPDGAERLQEAENNGHQLEIPLAEFVGKVAATEYYDSLVEQAALREGGMTFSEARVVKEELPKALEVIAAEATRPDRVISEQTQIQKDIESQMLQAGVRPKEARANAKIMAMTFNTRAKVLGKSALQLYKDENISITREGAIQGKTFFQSKVPKGFYSKLEKNITEKMGNSATVQQVEGILKDIKPEERKWSGIDEFLSGKTKVSKQELQDYLRANQLKIEEVVRSGDTPVDEDTINSMIEDDAVNAYVESEDYHPHFYDLNDDGYFEVGGPLAERGEVYDTKEEAERAVEKYNNKHELQFIDYFIEEADRDSYIERASDSDGSAPTKFSEYVLPGGENYREVLFTMPENPLAKVQEVPESINDLNNWNSSTRKNMTTFAAAYEARNEKLMGLISELEELKGKERDIPVFIKHLKREESDQDWLDAEVLSGTPEDVAKNTLPKFKEIAAYINELEKNDTTRKVYTFKLPSGRNLVVNDIGIEGPRKFYLAPGASIREKSEGKNFEEILPAIREAYAKEAVDQEVFKSKHFEEKNILAHTRLTDRVDENGDKVLFVEEIQSDWHQAGRERGYKGGGEVGDSTLKELAAQYDRAWASTKALAQKNTQYAIQIDRLKKENASEEELNRVYENRSKIDEELERLDNERKSLTSSFNERAKLIGADYRIGNYTQDLSIESQNQVPDAPFRKSWHEFTFKKILLEAAQKGYKKVAWTTGDQQAKRYKRALLEKVDEFKIAYNAKDDTYALVAYYEGDIKRNEPDIKESRVHELVGKSLGTQLVEAAKASAKNNEVANLKGESFDIGGEGMRGFYDKILVNFANNFGKKFGAKTQDVGIDVGEFSGSEEDFQKGEGTTFTKVHSLEITPQLKEAALNEGFALFQDERGKIIFGDDSVNIALLANADRSTFLHETAHLYLKQMMNDYATILALPEKSDLQNQFIKDSENILKWLEVNSFEEITVDHHEKFARGFEAYLMEGKAPSKDLRRIFALFRSWLLDIYKGMRALNVELNDEVREVFGRLIIVDDKINESVNEQKISDFSKKLQSIGLSKAQSERYAKLRDEHRIKATEILQGKVLADYKRTKESFYKDRFNKIKKEVTANVEKIPVYAFLDAARSGKKNVLGVPLKLSKSTLVEMYGEEQVKLLPKGILSDTEGNHPDIIVGMFGFDSTAQMVDSLQKAIPKKDLIVQESQRIMDIRYPSLLTMEDNLKDEAAKAVHNDMREEVMELELQIMLDENFPMAKNIIKQTIKRMPSKKFVKDEATKTVGKRKISELKPHLFRRAESKAAKEAGEFLVKGDIDSAIESKNKERLNFALYNSAVEAKEQYIKDLKFFKKLFKKDEDLAKNRDMNYVDAARAVLANFGLGETGKSASDYLELIKRYDPSAYEGLMPIIESITVKPMDFNELTVEQFNEVSALVNGLWDLAKAAKEIDVNGEKFSKEQAIQELVLSMQDLKQAKPEIKKAAPGKKEEWKIALLGTKASLRRVESWVDYMDLGKIDGPFRKYIYNLATQGLNDYRLDKVKFVKKYEELLKPMREAFKPKKILAKNLNVEFRHKGELLGALLHTGNISNKKKLLVGKGWGSVDDSGTLNSNEWDNFINSLIKDGTLTKQDFDFVQSVWNLFEELKPAAQRAHKKIYGRYFAEITANEFSNEFGTYRGGYAPAMADKMEAVEARVREDANIIEDAANSFMFPQTDKGFTKSRVEYNAPLVIDMGLVGQHIDKVLRFTHLEFGVKQAYSLISNSLFKQELNQVDNTLGTDMLVPWLQRIATQQVERQGNFIFNKQLDSFFKYIRKNTGMNIMFANVINTLQQVTGISIAAVKVNKKNLMSSTFEYLVSPKKTAEIISEKSKFMKTRMDNQMFESFEAIDEILTNPNAYEKLQKFGGKHAYILQQFLQNAVDSVVWSAAYDQAVGEGKSEQLAIQSADSAIRLTQSSMNPEDISNFEVGSASYRSFIMFYNYFNMQANLLGTEFAKSIRQSGLKKSFPRLLYVYFMGLAVPAILSEMMVRAGAGEDWDEDDDGFYLDDVFSMMFYAQGRNAVALVPLVGAPINAGVNAMNDKPYDDRMSISPAISVLESTVLFAGRTSYVLLSDDKEINKKKTTKDFLSAIGIFTGLPVMPLGKPIGYIIDVEEGRANPSGPVDYTRGLITGRPGEQ